MRQSYAHMNLYSLLLSVLSILLWTLLAFTDRWHPLGIYLGNAKNRSKIDQGRTISLCIISGRVGVVPWDLTWTSLTMFFFFISSLSSSFSSDRLA